jgi:hypothetical protein
MSIVVTTLPEPSLGLRVPPVLVPRTEALIRTIGEVAYSLGVSDDQVAWLNRGLDAKLIETAIIYFLRADGYLAHCVELRVDWMTHEASLRHDSDRCIELRCGPKDSIARQIDKAFEEHVRYVAKLKRLSRVTRVEAWIRFRPEIYRDPERYREAQCYMGSREAPPPPWAPDVYPLKSVRGFNPGRLKELGFVLIEGIPR